MRYIFLNCIVIYFLSVPMFIGAQDNSEIRDKLSKQLDSSYNLVIKSRYYEAIQIAENVIKNKHTTEALSAKAYNTLGMAFTEIKPKDGLEYFLKAEAYYKKQNNIPVLITLYNNIGINFMLQDSIEKSNNYFKEALNLSNDYKTNPNLVYPTYNLAGNIINYGTDYGKAIQYLNIALEATNENNYYELSEIYKNLGNAYLKLKDYKQAHFYLDKAIAILKTNSYLQGLKEAYHLKSELLGNEINYKKAFAVLQSYIAVNDSIFDETNDAITKKLETEYILKKSEQELEYLKREKENEKQLHKQTKLINLGLIIFTGLLLLVSYLLYRRTEQFKEAKEKAERLSKAKADFYSEVSHELRTPLYAVIELSGVLMREGVKANNKEYLKSLNFSATHLLALINNVLQLNKLGYRKMIFNNVAFDLQALISGVIDSLEYALSESKNTIELNYDNTIPEELNGDSLKISQIFINLISNAVKFTKNGTIKVVIKNIAETKHSVDVYCEVSDTGEGISEKNQKYIFDDFYQDTSKVEVSNKGTGLGLSIVKRTLDAMGTGIDLKSEVGKGSTFSFTVSLNKPVTLEKNHTVKESYIDDLKTCKILIVDDNKVNQLVTKKILDQFSLNSEVVSSGQEAIDIVKAQHFDCVLMDLHMPNMDGYQATQQIRSFNKTIAIVALTAASQEEVDEKMSKYDMQDYIMKPFITDVFIRKIAQAIESKKA